MQDAHKLTLIKRQLERRHPEMKGNENDKTYRTAVLLLAAVYISGANVDNLTHFTGYPRDFVAAVFERVCESGLWHESGQTHSDHWFQGDSGSTATFCADVLVGEGLAVAEPIKESGFRYWAGGKIPGTFVV